MRVVRLHAAGGPEQLAVEEADEPRPGPTEALVRVHAAAITRGELEWPVDRLPAIPSYELSGVIEEVGPDAAGAAEGDEVFALTPFDRDGVAADYAAVRAELLVPRPRNLGHAESAAIPLPALSAFQGLFDHGRLAADERVLIHGAAGSVGAFAVQLARQAGAHVIGTASGASLDVVHEIGAHEVLELRGRRGTRRRRLRHRRRRAAASLPRRAAPRRTAGLGGGGAPRWRHVLRRRAESRPAPRAREARGERRSAPPPVEVFPLTAAPEAFARSLESGRRGKVVLAVAP